MKTTEDFISTSNTELFYKMKDIPTYLHYSGSTANPHLTSASVDITELTARNITDDPGCGHRVIIKTINFIIKPRTLNDKPHCA
jgi:hypothetical protein